jgi:hypothetical protein
MPKTRQDGNAFRLHRLIDNTPIAFNLHTSSRFVLKLREIPLSICRVILYSGWFIDEDEI